MKKLFISLVFIITSLLAQTNVNDSSKNNEIQIPKQICKDSKSLEIKKRGCCS